MNAETVLADTAALFLALGDKTRLRLLNLMRDREICVSSFTDVLGQSQPLISRHLAYLRNSGLVQARRDGKWIYYSVSPDLDQNSDRLLIELFKWMEQQEGLRLDRDKYFALTGEPPSADSSATTPKPNQRSPRKRRVANLTREITVPTVETEEKEPDTEHDDVHHYEVEQDAYARARHNELEDFLL